MPLSSVVGAQSIVKPGVCTSSTRPASPYDGQVIYETDTDRAMVWNGTGWVVLSTGRANSLGLDLVKTQTIGTAVSSVVVSDAFSSTYDNYRIILSGGVGSANANISMIFGSTTANYAYNNVYMAYNSTTVTGEASNSASSWLRVARSSANNIDGEIELKSPFETKRTMGQWRMSSSASNELWSMGGGYLNDSTSYTAFTFTPSVGTLTGGTIAVYGYAK